MTRPLGESKQGLERILVRASNWVGDVVMGLPALEAVKAGFPESRLTVLARPWVTELFEAHPAVGEVMEIRKGKGLGGSVAEVLRVSSRVRERSFNMAVLFQNAFEAALISRLGGIPIRVGYDTDWRGPLLSHPVPKPGRAHGKHQVDYYLDLVRLGLGLELDCKEPRLFLSREAHERAKSLLARAASGSGEMILGVAPGAAFGPAKRWPPERFAKTADRAASTWGARTVIFGSRQDSAVCGQMESLMEHRPVNLCGSTGLGEAAGLIACCSLFLTNDSGLMHVSAALGVPTVAVFGSTDPHATGPRGRLCRVVRLEVDCSPCLRPTCPRDFSCMLGVSEGMVWREMELLVRGFPGPGSGEILQEPCRLIGKRS